ncbi:MAG: DNA translocase FtsK [Sphingomonas sp.]|uniref:FtsK/SpoIIIE family DNA translocase n=1 Tax=Sphingomonas sp. TaxID=28214 RepID=UPI00122B2E21|nr:DNA translocase FtsK 4TM domain-containing protein [Sphingomonas sp.]THD35949.1 MAG: DNA translocase FtsK [Sphingomonas sp.]
MASRAQPPLWRETVKAGAARGWRMVGAIAVLTLTLALAAALLTYRSGDPSLSTAAGGPAENLFGTPGAFIADLALSILGLPVSGLLAVGAICGLRLWRDEPIGHWGRMLTVATVGIALVATGLAFWSPAASLRWPAGLGGLVGMVVAGALDWVITLIGNPTAILWSERLVELAFVIVGAVVWFMSLGLGLPRMPRIALSARSERLTDRREPAPAPEQTIRQPRALALPDARPGPVIAERSAAVAQPKPARGPKQASLDLRDNYRLPTLDMLKAPPPSANGPVDKAALERNARLLETVLDDFHVKGSIIEVRPGPVVTMYELDPAPGIKASRVIQLADDIARNMSAISARVATVPGRTVIGIELPNAKRETVSLHELVASDTFEDQSASLPLILGKNIAGDPVVVDLAPMPHLLVAGTTGSGKSVGLNCMILSLLYRLNPDQCKMIMIDPKMLELSMYDDIPHLLAPVVTDPAKAVRALKWAVEQMEERYRQMSSVGVRSLASFNDKVRAARAKGQPLGRKVQIGYENGKPVYEEEQLDFQPLPQIVIVVDELADLMMTAGKEVEFLIQRLAQKARAAGIHLIMATQRPSVDVITGVIKANLPTRISFNVTSKIDSRTILGEQGAEQLLGKGDMLYMAYGKQISRVHGPFVSDDEVRAVADHWRAQGQPDYVQSVTEESDDGFALDGAPLGEDSAEDQQYRGAIQLVVESQKASTSWLQRQMRIGYNSAARLIERMEKDGIVGRPDHVGRREVLRDRDGNPL